MVPDYGCIDEMVVMVLNGSDVPVMAGVHCQVVVVLLQYLIHQAHYHTHHIQHNILIN